MIAGSDPLVNEKDVNKCYSYVIKDIQNKLVGFANDNYGGLTGNTLLNPRGERHAAIRRDDGKYRVYWISGGINSDGSDLYITLENLIMSDADVVYKDSIASEFFANSMAANLCRDSKDLRAYNFYYQDTIDYFEKMLEAMY